MRMGIGIEKLKKMTIPIQFKRVLNPFFIQTKIYITKMYIKIVFVIV